MSFLLHMYMYDMHMYIPIFMCVNAYRVLKLNGFQHCFLRYIQRQVFWFLSTEL